MTLYAVIMAGGVGSRFWPQSREAHPKQYLNVFGDASLMQATLGRLSGLVPPERCFVVTNKSHVQKTQRQLPAVPAGNILAEPMRRNTAPCIAYAASRIAHVDPEATLVVLPADSVISDVGRFHQALRTAAEAAQATGRLVTLGVEPSRPETGYGYIEYDRSARLHAGHEHEAFQVKQFREKPDRETAQHFMEAGTFLWNSGMFVWRVGSVLDAFATHLPRVYDAFAPVRAGAHDPGTVEAGFEASPSVSVDYGIMEHAGDVAVVPVDFGWDDLGDWRAVYDLSPKDARGNALDADAVAVDSTNCLARTADGRYIALVGVDDLLVVDTPDALLVCHKDATQRIKTIVEQLRETHPGLV